VELILGPLKIHTECWDEALHCFGTAAIFRKRANRARLRLRILTFLGIVVPASVGGLVLSFGTDFQYKNLVIVFASIFGLIQLVLSIWSLVAKWEDSFAYSLESLSVNDRLSSLFQELAKAIPIDSMELKTRYELLQAENRDRRARDNQQLITEKEHRFGMRAALRQFQRTCISCKKVPTSLTPTNCDICGNF
jgi:mobilome CxxCx(11)CxxC protein